MNPGHHHDHPTSARELRLPALSAGGLPGLRLGVLSAGPLQADDQRRAVASIRAYAPDLHVPMHEIAFPCVELLLAGPHPETCGGVERTCQVGVAQYRPPGVTMSGNSGPTGSVEFAVNLPPACRHYRLDPTGHPALTPIMTSALFDLLARDACTDLSVHAAIEEMYGLLTGQGAADGRRPGWLSRVIDRLHAVELDSPALSELADDANVDASHLARTFRAHFRCTPGQYARLIRLQRAATVLATTDASIAHIAFDHGFSDQSHFGRNFRTRFGMTPRDFRRAVHALGSTLQKHVLNDPRRGG